LLTAGELAQQLTNLAHHQRETDLVLAGQAAVGAVGLLRGNLVAARAHLEPYLSRSDPPPPTVTPLHSGRYYFRVTHLAWVVQVLWELGYADQAQQRSVEALVLAQQFGDPPSLAYAQLFGAILAQFRRDIAATNTHADALMTFATAQGLALRVECGRILRGWALAIQGDAAAGVAHIHQGLGAVHSIGLKLYRPYFLALLAEAYGQAGQPEAALTVLAEALTLVAATEERWWEAELYRLQGALLLQLPSPDTCQAEGCFRQALDVARRQQAKALELRAALSLGRLWQGQGKWAVPRQLLAESYCWFTEGFDTADLQEAKALLEELGVKEP
jgi:predicted ATPase